MTARPLPRTAALDRWRRVVASLIPLLTVILITGCDRAPYYSQSSPEAVIDSAVEMIRNDDAKYLPNLIYADSPEMRAVLNRLGMLTSNLQKLAKAVQARYPEQLAEINASFSETIESGRGGKLLGAVASGATGRRQGPPTADDANQRQDAETIMARIFADPFGWMTANADRLSAMLVSDDLATVLVDDKPVFPPFGIPLCRGEDKKWYLLLPTKMAPISSFMPRTRDQWSIIASLIKIFDNTVVELTADVEAGRIESIKKLASKAGEKVIFPALIAFGAYGREMDVRERSVRRVRDFNTKFESWKQARIGAATTDLERSFSAPLKGAIDRIAPIEVEKAVRANERQRFTEMSDVVFQELLQGWLLSSGLTVDLTDAICGPAIDSVAEAWEARRAAEAAAKKRK